MKIIIAGSRDYHKYNEVEELVDTIINSKLMGGINEHEIEIVSGGALGADALGEQYANKNFFYVAKFPAKWKQHGKAAGPIRNEQMAKYADALIAFWDGESPGTKDMVNKAKKHGLDPIIVKVI